MLESEKGRGVGSEVGMVWGHEPRSDGSLQKVETARK